MFLGGRRRSQGVLDGYLMDRGGMAESMRTSLKKMGLPKLEIRKGIEVNGYGK